MDAPIYRVNRPDVIDEHFDDEYVVVNLRTGTYYSLNRPAAEIWDLLSQNRPRNMILEQMQRLYEAESAHIDADLDSLLGEMVKEQLIVPGTFAAPVSAPGDSAIPEHREYQAPRMEKYTDMQALLLLDPIHQVDESGWPATKPDAQ